LQWLHGEGYRVILVIPADSLDGRALDELRKVTYAVYWTKPALRTRLGKRLPYLRELIWEPLKPALRLMNQDETSDQQPNSSVGNDQIKRGLCPDSLISLVGKLARRYRPQAVIAEYIFLTRCFAHLPPGTLKIIDTIDVFSRKQDQVLAFGIEDAQACTEDEERQYLLQADVIVAIQSREAELLKALVPEREVVLAGMDFEVADSLSSSVAQPNSIAAIASDNALNVHGLRAFLTECWPDIKVACPDVSLHVVGKVGDECRAEDSSIHYTRWVDDLSQVYREARVIINPTVAGTGLKIKSAQALAHGKPLVAWTSGVEGLDYKGEPPYIECRSWQEFAAAVVRLLRSESEVKTLAKRALSYGQREFRANEVYASLKACLEEHLSPDYSWQAGDTRRATRSYEDSTPSS
jgi:glycosyltransferase involved in cell wall biosynthesis